MLALFDAIGQFKEIGVESEIDLGPILFEPKTIIPRFGHKNRLD